MDAMGFFALLAVLEHTLYMFPLRAWLDRVIPFYGSQICFSDDIFPDPGRLALCRCRKGAGAGGGPAD